MSYYAIIWFVIYWEGFFLCDKFETIIAPTRLSTMLEIWWSKVCDSYREGAWFWPLDFIKLFDYLKWPCVWTAILWITHILLALFLYTLLIKRVCQRELFVWLIIDFIIESLSYRVRVNFPLSSSQKLHCNKRIYWYENKTDNTFSIIIYICNFQGC